MWDVGWVYICIFWLWKWLFGLIFNYKGIASELLRRKWKKVENYKVEKSGNLIISGKKWKNLNWKKMENEKK